MLPPPLQGFIHGPKFINPDCYFPLLKTKKPNTEKKKGNLFFMEDKIIDYITPHPRCLVSH